MSPCLSIWTRRGKWGQGKREKKEMGFPDWEEWPGSIQVLLGWLEVSFKQDVRTM